MVTYRCIYRVKCHQLTGLLWFVQWKNRNGSKLSFKMMGLVSSSSENHKWVCFSVIITDDGVNKLVFHISSLTMSEKPANSCLYESEKLPVCQRLIWGRVNCAVLGTRGVQCTWFPLHLTYAEMKSRKHSNYSKAIVSYLHVSCFYRIQDSNLGPMAISYSVSGV